ncbi:MAG: hypothetical protein ABI670_05080 [Chloroflexota bacterium]
MSSEAKLVTCALCGNKMAIDAETCPKCGSLNAHRGYQATISPVVWPNSNVQSIPSPVEVEQSPLTTARKIASRRRPVPVPPASAGKQSAAGQLAAWQYAAVQSPPHYEPSIQGGSKAADYWAAPAPHRLEASRVPGPPVLDDPDTELPNSWREGVVRVRPRAIVREEMEAFFPNANTARKLELLGCVGFLGLGHIYGGWTMRGVLLMLCWWGIIGTMLLPSLLTPIPAAEIAPRWVLSIGLLAAVPVVSGLWIKRDVHEQMLLRRRNDLFEE